MGARSRQEQHQNQSKELNLPPSKESKESKALEPANKMQS
jgi:hypothetical protein